MVWGRKKKKQIKVIDEPEEDFIGEPDESNDEGIPEEEDEQEKIIEDKPRNKFLQKKPALKQIAKVVSAKTREDGLFEYTFVSNTNVWQIGEVFDL